MSNTPDDAHPDFPVPGREQLDLARVLKTAADPARLVVLARLADGEYHPCNLTDYRLDMHKSTLSHHFKALREAGFTHTRVTGREHAVRLRRADLDARWPGLLDAILAAALRDQPTAGDAPARG